MELLTILNNLSVFATLESYIENCISDINEKKLINTEKKLQKELKIDDDTIAKISHYIGENNFSKELINGEENLFSKAEDQYIKKYFDCYSDQKEHKEKIIPIIHEYFKILSSNVTQNMTTGEKVLAKGIINIQDEITKTRETTDRILKIVSESNNTKSKQNPDNDLSDFIYKCLDRAGFREPTMYEFDIKDMLKAFEDTSCALSTGILKDREGNTILEYHGSTTFSDNSLSSLLTTMKRELSRLTTLVKTNMKKSPDYEDFDNERCLIVYIDQDLYDKIDKKKKNILKCLTEIREHLNAQGLDMYSDEENTRIEIYIGFDNDNHTFFLDKNKTEINIVKWLECLNENNGSITINNAHLQAIEEALKNYDANSSDAIMLYTYKKTLENYNTSFKKMLYFFFTNFNIYHDFIKSCPKLIEGCFNIVFNYCHFYHPGSSASLKIYTPTTGDLFSINIPDSDYENILKNDSRIINSHGCLSEMLKYFTTDNIMETEILPYFLREVVRLADNKTPLPKECYDFTNWSVLKS